MNSEIDLNGQPINRLYNRKQRHDRSLDELIGLSKGIAADNVVNLEEARFLQGWLQNNWELKEDWPFNVLYGRLDEMLADGVLDQEEQAELLGLLHQLTGHKSEAETVDDFSTELPLDRPAPLVDFDDRTFCFTGKFAFGTRKDCEAATKELGACCHPRVTMKTDYLVIGFFGSRDWAHSSLGRKIEHAVELKDKGSPLFLISEDHWAKHAFGLKQYSV